ncbi:1421_t:CDS:2, partial [Paraglomus occultum]
FTSDSKQEILDAFIIAFGKISESDIVKSRTTTKAKKLYNNARETFQRREIIEFFEKLDQEFDARQNERELERSFDRNGCELLRKSSDFNTLKLLSRYAEKSAELLEKGSGYSLRRKRNIDYNEEHMRKRLHRDRETTPSPCSHLSLPMDNPFIEDNEEEDEDSVIIINDVDELCFEEGDPANDFKIGDTNVSQLFRQYQNESLKIAKTGGLLVESNVHEILSLSSIFLLTPGSYPNTMIDIFSSPLLDEIHKKIVLTQPMELDSECELKFRRATKKAIKESRESAVDWLWSELSNDQILKENLGVVFLECLRSLPTTKIKNQSSELTLITNHLDHIMKMMHNPDKHIVEWPNTALNESKVRKLQGRTRQPDFTISILHQLQRNGVIFVGEVSAPSEKNNVYKNCNDLIRVGIFMKDCLDSAIEKGADIKVLGFQCIGQVTIPTFLKELSSFIEDMELLLT